MFLYPGDFSWKTKAKNGVKYTRCIIICATATALEWINSNKRNWNRRVIIIFFRPSNDHWVVAGSYVARVDDDNGILKI